MEIKVEKEDKTKEETKHFTRREYNYSAFYRSFNLPETVNTSQIKADYEDGVLNVHLLKLAETKKEPLKQIAVL